MYLPKISNGFRNLSGIKRADNKEVVLEKFKLTFQKQCLWNEVLKIEKSSDAQLGRSFEFSLPKEWNRQEQIEYTTDYIQKNLWTKACVQIGAFTIRRRKPACAFTCNHASL